MTGGSCHFGQVLLLVVHYRGGGWYAGCVSPEAK